jgi:diphosphomevalonate decarboxylase
MKPLTATAIACANIALIKYWGDRDSALRIPANGSISMNLAGLTTTTQVFADPGLDFDSLSLNGGKMTGSSLERMSTFLEHVRKIAGVKHSFRVSSTNNFPTGAGLASSASAFAALALAATKTCGLNLSEAELSRLARLGSGSACRSIPAGFVEWQVGDSHATSFAFSLAPPEHWEVVDCIALLDQEPKTTSSTQGHALANTSPLQPARLNGADQRLVACREAILKRDFEALARIVELDSDLMHAVMMTSSPPLLYWQPGTVAIMHAVREWRSQGTPVCYTIDAGPNVHVLCPSSHAEWVESQLARLQGVLRVITAKPGGAARILDEKSV